MESLTICTNLPEQTEKVGEILAQDFSAGDVVVLGGALGAGKTTLVKGIGRALGIKDLIVSPTFVLLSRYEGSDINLVHLDAYRLEKLHEVLDLGFEEYVDDSVIVIEWGKYIAEVLPDITLIIELAQATKDWNSRVITINVLSNIDRFEPALDKLHEQFK